MLFLFVLILFFKQTENMVKNRNYVRPEDTLKMILAKRTY